MLGSAHFPGLSNMYEMHNLPATFLEELRKY